ncbi:MAG: riboflavin biosynthesis protein RibF [Candidatus Aminicenantes bacterium]|nr:riboflavin biosynthesis protein RibF [Candidatus Aminicenantes bacterium]
MVVYRGLDDPRLRPRPAAVALGNFDGLHLGHRRILDRLCRLSAKRGLRSLVLTFEPHPERALGKRDVRMIDTPGQRLARLCGTCVDAVVVIPFDRAFARLGGAAFFENILKGGLGAREIVVGRGFRFGRDRRGGAALLRRLGPKTGIGIHVVAPAVIGGRAVSSTAVRRLLALGRAEEAARYLGRAYEITGCIVRGRRRGRRLGFPTANVATPNEILPEGVFITETSRGRTAHPSVTSIGTNPTFGPHPLSVETLLLDFKGSLYGAEVTVRFLRQVRPTQAFPDAASLADRIRRDVEEARAWFARRG